MSILFIHMQLNIPRIRIKFHYKEIKKAPRLLAGRSTIIEQFFILPVIPPHEMEQHRDQNTFSTTLLRMSWDYAA